MDMVLFKKIIEEIADKNKDAEVWMTYYGEALLLRYKLYYMIEYAKKKGLEYVILNTNAMLLNGEMGHMLIDSGLDRLIFSVDGFSKETYEKIRVYSEEQKLSDIIEAVRMRSFLRQVPQAITFKDKSLGLKNKDVLVGFEYITFPEATITYNGNGFPDKHALRHLVRGREKVLNVL